MTKIIMLAKRVGERIRQHRHRLGYSQEYLGSKAGLSHSTVSKMEAGNYALSLGHLEALANALGIQPEDLVRGQPTHTKTLEATSVFGNCGLKEQRGGVV